MSFLSGGGFFKKAGATLAANIPTLHQYFDGTVKGIASSGCEHGMKDRRYDQNQRVVASKLMELASLYAAAGNPSPTHREEGVLQACHDARVSFGLPLNHHVVALPGDAGRIAKATFNANF